MTGDRLIVVQCHFVSMSFALHAGRSFYQAAFFFCVLSGSMLGAGTYRL
jgi:hypothetical protein